MRTAAAKARCSVPFILAALAALSCVFLVHAAAAAAAAAVTTTTTSVVGYRRALLPREAAAVVMPTTSTAEDAAVVGMAGVEGELPVVADEAAAAAARRMDMQTTQDYPSSGANSRHDPRNPH
ncbi:unknown protein [Oryza sativa Japonica Group]|uniref:Os01g0276900 protein n=2 Tax=Oryza sativa subsp. japonica TaxID=39947 RepID=Q5NBP8_ORYSJ|nr:uncharacterized LOC9271754 precursor [Oryza sativa Japonica Group]KAB8080981.1 hypothetical protein EE612_001778 [Oryza sativa]EEE54324.1 hypothetical protein OsJ_01292 [Oryza sativa Japonica Group]BAD81118.1 unknown protein [Oryza sativa Japonica Group]BAG97105.1 unnamed protein product [Oryza sativa Japonica Group]BAH91007.1 Os01g0276900 [Oryza sativa Japonica Group]|eukprot:NP_001172277.1 Os01g0276900 [Oryza sativa Japonica Group]